MTLPRSIGRNLNFATGRLNALCQKLLDPHGLSLAQWVILSCLWREGDLSVGALSELVGSGLPATSRIIDRMIESGLVSRRRHQADGRVMVVALTDKGRELDHLADFYQRINDIMLKGFTEEEAAQAFDLLSRMQRNAQDALS
ncbi:MarR family winged helix-turn-helix transcriptional regulator [Thalassococcus sp. BH17M4-6]|uniref:MarR family winged helix-turn-helix transcriptional regulator n=1 Tax=Thalassococcus sp. BH17M4-6 TaxID=3413148 RepID=UPI003BD49AA6